jgi:DNA gyrase subunit A
VAAITGYVSEDGRALASPGDGPTREIAPLRLAGSRLAAVLATDPDTQLDVFTENGLCYRGSFASHEPQTGAGDGEPLVTLIEGDRICGIACARGASHYAFVTERGGIKRIEQRTVAKADEEGIVAFAVPLGDRIVAVVPHGADGDILISTAGGKLLRIEAATVRPVQTGDAGGVAGIALADDDEVVSACNAEGEELLVVHAGGAGKRVPLGEYPRKGRATASSRRTSTGRRAGPARPARWPARGRSSAIRPSSSPSRAS